MIKKIKEQKINKIGSKAWIVSADMGYGHQRTAFPLRDLAPNERVINANHYEGIPKKDRNIWQRTRIIYEFISRFKKIPFIGEFIFGFLDKFQKILNYYPKRDLSGPSFGVKSNFYLISRGWGKDLIKRFQQDPLPIVSTFFTPAFMAESFNYLEDIYCVVCDADANRAWVPLNPEMSRIKYFAPCTWVRDRLKLYGVKSENIFLSGYPLPKENLGTEKLEIVKTDMAFRLLNLDPMGKYRKIYAPLIKDFLGKLPEKSDHPLTILFSVGGAGAQKEIGLQAINSLKEKIKAKEIKIIISVGIRKELKKYYENEVAGLKLDGFVQILSAENIIEYFKKFNLALRKTDILWTKPSELSFYAGFGIPIIIAPTIGSQEDFNKKWLLHIGAGTAQENPKYTAEWLFDLLNAGDFAEMAMQGFVEIEKKGVFNIENIITGKNKLKTSK